MSLSATFPKMWLPRLMHAHLDSVCRAVSTSEGDWPRRLWPARNRSPPSTLVLGRSPKADLADAGVMGP